MTAIAAPPPVEPVWWVATHGDSTCHVLTRTWFDARCVAMAELDCGQDEVEVVLSDSSRDELFGKVARNG